MKCQGCSSEHTNIRTFSLSGGSWSVRLCPDCLTACSSNALSQRSLEQVRSRISTIWETKERQLLEVVMSDITTEMGVIQHRADEEDIPRTMYLAIIAWDKKKPVAERQFNQRTKSVTISDENGPVARITFSGVFRIFNLEKLGCSGKKFDHRLIRWKALRDHCENIGLLRKSPGRQ